MHRKDLAILAAGMMAGLLCAGPAAAQRATGRTEATTGLPAVKLKEGAEKVSLLKVYKVGKWDLGPQSPSYAPNEGEEVIVVRFYRQALKPGQEIPKHALTLLDTDGRPLERNTDLWRLAAGAWVEWVVINDMPFDLRGLAIPAQALPLHD